MRDLEERIAEWRGRLRAAGIRAPAVLDELESHLREDMERQTRVGASEGEAFAAAIRRIGDAWTLQAEFADAAAERTPRSVRLMWIFALASTGLVILLGAVTFFACFATWGERAVAFAALAFNLLAIYGWRYLVPFLPVITNKRKRIALELVCLGSGIGTATFFGQVILPHFVNQVDQIPAIGFWLVVPLALFLGLACGIEEAARRQTALTAS